jgi:hypothetical protein
MDLQFETEVMQDLAGGTPFSAEDAAVEASLADDEFDEGFQGDALDQDDWSEHLDGFEEGMDGIEGEALAEGYDEDLAVDGVAEGVDEDLMDFDAAQGATDLAAALEDAVGDALDAEDSDEFLSQLLRGVRRVAGLARRGLGAAQGVAGAARRGVAAARRPGRGSRPTGRPRAGGAPRLPPALQSILGRLLPMLQQQAAQGADELELFEDLADWFEDEGVDEALPVLAGIAARAAVRPLIRRAGTALSRGAGRALVRGATRAARTLVGQAGPGAVRALRPIARSVGRAAARRGAPPAALPAAVRRTAAQVAAQPALVRRLSRPGLSAGRAVPARRPVAGRPRRFVVNGPVEIIVRR